MPEQHMVEALRTALDQEMDGNDKVVLLGEDIGVNGGVFRVTEGLIDKYGSNRVIDTPLSETGIIGFATGMALYGLNPVAEIQFIDFIWSAFDQIKSEVSTYRYRSGGQFTCPLVIRGPYGGGVGGAIYHSQSPEDLFIQTPGIKVVIPSGPYDAKGLLTSAMRSSDPILFMEPKRIYRAFREEVPEEEYTVPIGKAELRREGEDVTLISYGSMLRVALEGAEKAAEEGLECDVLDLRTLLPLDLEALEESVKKTGRIVSVTEAPKSGGFGAELSALIAERWIEYILAPILRVAGFDTPFPFIQEHDYLPDVDRVLDAVNEVYNF